MPCELCRAYLHDYFQQPLEKENPLFPLVSQRRLQTSIPEITQLLLRFHSSTLNPFILRNAKSDMDNYFTFLVKPTDPYQTYRTLFQFLKRNKKVESELKGLQAEILAYDFLKIKRNDPHASVVETWLSFLVGSLFEELYQLHEDHTKKDIRYFNLDRGLPGQPRTAKKIKKDVSDTKCVAANDQDDDLYT